MQAKLQTAGSSFANAALPFAIFARNDKSRLYASKLMTLYLNRHHKELNMMTRITTKDRKPEAEEERDEGEK
jgi:hypothetical protein